MSYGARADISTPSFPPQTRPAIPVGFLGYSKPRLVNSRSPGSETVSGVIRVFFEGGLGSATSMKRTVRPEKNMRPVFIDRRV